MAHEPIPERTSSDAGPACGATPCRWERFDGEPAIRPADAVESDDPTPISVRIEFGRARPRRDEVQKLRVGDIVPLDNHATDLVGVYANGRLVARGEPLVVDGRIGVRVVELISPVEP
ncbi:MAG: FliM/FliN family flagellar motor switch protein [Thermoguttaceae bacterium]